MSDRGNTDGATRRRVKATGPTPTAGASPGIANGVNLRHASVASASKPPRRRKASSYPRRTWTIPLAIILGFFFLYALNPTESNVVHRFLFLSYKLDRNDGGPQHYAKGIWDIAYVVFFTCVLSFTREFIMYEMLQPLARLLKIQPLGKQLRFMEQMYTAVYIAFIGPLGVYCMKHSPVWYFNTAGMYEGFPHKTHTADLKFYYLFQAAFWLQQVLVMILGVEKRRKDFRELVCHHIVTIALIGLSYRFHFAYMGIAVYLTHDISDFFLAVRSLPLYPYISGAPNPGTSSCNDILTRILCLSVDLQVPELPRQPTPGPVLRALYRCMGLPAALH